MYVNLLILQKEKDILSNNYRFKENEKHEQGVFAE